MASAAAIPSGGTDLAAVEKPVATSDTDLGAADAPASAADPAAPAPWAEYHGAPVDETGAPKAYEFVAPDGYPIDTDLVPDAESVARDLNLSPKGAQKLVDLKVKDLQLQAKRWGDHLSTLRTEALADPEIGGANYAPTVARAKAVIAKYGDAELRTVLNHYGVGAHRAMIRFLGKLGTAVGETATLPSGAGAGAVTKKPLYETLYKD